MYRANSNDPSDHGYCVWIMDGHATDDDDRKTWIFTVSCGNDISSLEDLRVHGFKLCPYCGNKLHVSDRHNSTPLDRSVDPALDLAVGRS